MKLVWNVWNEDTETCGALQGMCTQAARCYNKKSTGVVLYNSSDQMKTWKIKTNHNVADGPVHLKEYQYFFSMTLIMPGFPDEQLRGNRRLHKHTVCLAPHAPYAFQSFYFPVFLFAHKIGHAVHTRPHSYLFINLRFLTLLLKSNLCALTT